MMFASTGGATGGQLGNLRQLVGKIQSSESYRNSPENSSNNNSSGGSSLTITTTQGKIMKKTSATLSGAILIVVLLCCTCASQAEPSTSSSSSSSSSSKPSTATQSRQSAGSAAASFIGALGSLVPGLITNVAPLVLLVGIGALMMPALGMSALGLLNNARRSSGDQMAQPSLQLQNPFGPFVPIRNSPADFYAFSKRSFPSLMSGFNGPAFMRGMQEVLERVAKAIDNADKRYN